MLFISFEFIFLFLPSVLVGFALLHYLNYRFALIWLVLASLFFLGSWDPLALLVLAGSVTFNFVFGILITNSRGVRSQLFLAVGIIVDLCTIGVFKYADFFVETVNQAFGAHFSLPHIPLPLGISFFTFTQIAYLVDAYKRIASDHDPVRYSLFVTYFPHLIAGPILHHRPTMEQFADPRTARISWDNCAIGLIFFSIGLAKKLLLADPLGNITSPIFSAAEHGPLSFASAWVATITYTFQLYFDFSGYSDMAVGLSLLFGVRIPVNFLSPYKATSMIEFWRRWHISLSSFLRDYLYIPLGGNRDGPLRRYINLFLTMLLGGLWHGASWNFVIWGGLHGLFLLWNHAWRSLIRYDIGSWPGRVLTFLAVMIAWVFFRATDLGSAGRILDGLVSVNQIWDTRWYLDPQLQGLNPGYVVVLISIAASIAFLGPNSQQITEGFRHEFKSQKGDTFHLSYGWSAAFGILFGISIAFLGRASAFLYFRF